MQVFTATVKDEGKRADVFVSEKLPDFTRASLKQLFNSNLVAIAQSPIKPSYQLKKGNSIEINSNILYQKPEPISIPIIYEDEDVLVMNKPAGILTHSKGALNTEASVASFIKDKLTDLKLNDNRAGIVHRLDRATSGVIIAAKNENAVKFLQKKFSLRQVDKVYLAVVPGKLSPREALIDIPIERNPKKPQMFRAGISGKPAQTSYKVIRSFNRDGEAYSLLELKPRTGRTHQLRVHLEHIGHPIVGDTVYGNKPETNMLLHAASLELTLPSGEQKKFSAPLPPVFSKFIKATKNA